MTSTCSMLMTAALCSESFNGVLLGRFVGCGSGADNDQLMIGNVILIFKSGGQLGQSDSVFCNDAVHEFLEGGGVATFGGIEQVECVFNGEGWQLSLGIFQNGERTGEGICHRDFRVHDGLVVSGLKFGDFSGCWFQQAAVFGWCCGRRFGAATGEECAGGCGGDEGPAEAVCGGIGGGGVES